MIDKDADLLFAFLKKILFEEDVSDLDINLLTEEFKKLGKGMNFLNTYIKELKQFSTELSKGELDTQTSPSRENQLCWPLKTLQANLFHLTWQTQQVAKGDYSQNVDFLGDFSEAFNMMIEQLRQREEDYRRHTTEARNRAIQFQDMAFQDSDTRLYNRRYCMRILNEWLADKVRFTICYLDLDNLKRINDGFGHMEGDYYISMLAFALKKVFRASDIICRIGGDEFVVLILNATEEIVIARIKKAEIHFLEAGQKYRQYEIGFSYGIKVVDEHNVLGADALLEEADHFMYERKKKKKERQQLGEQIDLLGGKHDKKE